MPRRGFLADLNSTEWELVRKACKHDDAMVMDEAISMTAAEDLNPLYLHARTTAIKQNSINVLNYLSEHSVSFEDVPPVVAVEASKATLEFLLAHGWDINTQLEGRSIGDAEPFMWHVTEDIDMVVWCLENGASIYPRDQEPLSDDIITKSQQPCQPILERVARHGSVAVFKLLQSKGAPLGWRPLNLAVEYATHGKPEGAESDHIERMNMVRYLLDVVGLDVNAPDQPASGRRLRDHYGTPICYIPNSEMLEKGYTRAHLAPAGERCGSHSSYGGCKIVVSQIRRRRRGVESTPEER